MPVLNERCSRFSELVHCLGVRCPGWHRLRAHAFLLFPHRSTHLGSSIPFAGHRITRCNCAPPLFRITSTASNRLQNHIRFKQELLLAHQDHTQEGGKDLDGAHIFRCESAVHKIRMFRSDYLHFSSDASGTAILWEVTGGAAFSVWRSRQLDILRWASSIWTAVICDPMILNRSLSFSCNPVAIAAHVYART